MSEIKDIKKHLHELRKRLFKIIISITIITILILTLHINTDDYRNITIVYPTIEPFNNISIQLINHLKSKLIPENVELIQTSPGQAFFAQIHISLLIGTIITMPIILKEIIDFMKPALHKNEIQLGRSISLPAAILFVIGCCFAYFVTIPYLLEFLYTYGQYAGIMTFLNITDFVTFVLQFLLAFGISFELPLLMYATSKIGIVDKDFWTKNIRYSIVIIVIFGAVITPDGSGITMWLVSIPMILLYFIGIKIVK
ncbi:MAG: twin-arginine translocase subunit TatC [Nitrosopumilaceae archaeon]|nr:twin-arginine translocase subunit TatC [Nitrosopumilaceae archaeon]